MVASTKTESGSLSVRSLVRRQQMVMPRHSHCRGGSTRCNEVREEMRSASEKGMRRPAKSSLTPPTLLNNNI